MHPELHSSRISHSPKRRPWHRKLLFGMVLLLALLGFQELLFRFFFPIPETTRFNRIRYQLLAESDPRFRPLIKRGLVYDRLRLESQPDGWGHTHRLNRFGFRDRDFSIKPNPARKRILVVGDSITEGQGASAQETIPARLAKIMGSSAEVLNLGVIAATLDNVTQLACDATTLLDPKLVILVLYANDLPAMGPGVMVSPASLGVLKQRVEQDLKAASNEFWLPHSLRLFKRLITDQPIYSPITNQPIRYFAAVPDSTNPFSGQSKSNPRIKPELEQAMRQGGINPWLLQQADAIPGMLNHDFRLGGSAESAIRTILNVCRQQGADLVVTYVPFSGTVHERYRQPLIDTGMPHETAKALTEDPAYQNQARHLTEVCDRLRIKFIDTTPALKAEEASGQPQYWPYDTHPRPEGYRTIADAIAAGM